MRMLMAGLILWLAVRCEAAGATRPGDRDPSFGQSGFVTTAIGPVSFATSVQIQSDGRIVAAGSAAEGDSPPLAGSPALAFAVVRYEPDGNLDGTFGAGGIVTTTLGLTAQAAGLALQPDGRIVVVGSVTVRRPDPEVFNSPTSDSFGLARFDPDGSLDLGFGDDGKVITTFGDDQICRFGGCVRVTSVALQSDGKIVTAGDLNVSASRRSELTVLRHRPDGSLDETFGDQGVVRIAEVSDLHMGASGLAIQRDGKIVVAGTVIDSHGGGFFVLRLTHDGSLDSRFGAGGKVLTQFNGLSQASAVAIHRDGRIVVAGSTFRGFNRDLAVVRYRSNGTLDRTFNRTGKVTTDLGKDDSIGAIALQSNGKIVVTGSSVMFLGSPCLFSFRLLLVRYLPDGRLDSSFGEGGSVLDGPGPFGRSLLVQPDGKLVVAEASASDSCIPTPGSPAFLVARFLGDGAEGEDGRRRIRSSGTKLLPRR